MKKIMNVMKFIIIAMLMLCVSVPTVYAVETINFSTILTANKKNANRGDTIEVTIALGEFSNIGEGINSFMGKLEYDTTKLSIKSGEILAQNGWDTPTYENNILLTTKGSLITANEDIIKITFIVNEDAEYGKTTIAVNDVEAANTENDFVGKEGTVEVEITEKAVIDDGTGDKVDGDVVGGDKTDDDSGIDGDKKDPTTENPDNSGAGDIGTSDDKNSNDNKEEQPTTEGTTVVVGGENKDNTTANKEIPKAGLDTMLVIGIVIIAIVAIIMYRKNRKYDDIK